LAALLFGHAEPGFDDVAVAGFELLDSLVDEVAFGGFLGYNDAGPGTRFAGLRRLAETDGVFVEGCQGFFGVIVGERCCVTDSNRGVL
jgi:hypothetical protein